MEGISVEDSWSFRLVGFEGGVRAYYHAIIKTSGYGSQPQSHRAHGGRTTGDDYYSKANMLFLSSAGNKENFTPLRSLRLCG